MDLFTMSALLSSSVLIGGVIALFRFSQIPKVYYPFIFLIWIGCINETVSYFSAISGRYTILNNIIYDLLASLLLIWFFKNLGLFKNRKYIYYLLGCLFLVLWIFESFYSNRFGTKFNSYFGISYSFTLVLLSVTAINRLLFEEREIIKHPTFLICIAVLIYFTYKIVVEMFWLYGLKESRSFRINVLVILMFINFLCNLIYALAIIWMRRKQAFTLRF
jgi:hypothetical protein